MNSFTICVLAQFIWIVICLAWLLRRNDELPLICSTFLFYVFSFRFWAIISGLALPVDVTNFGFEAMSYDAGIEALQLAILGESVFLTSYFWTQRKRIRVPQKVIEEDLLYWIRRFSIVVMWVCVPVALASRTFISGQLEAGKSLGFEVSSYMFLFPLALVGVAILIAAVWRAGGFPRFNDKVFASGMFLLIALLTFQSSLRFQFLGWLIAATIIISSGQNLRRKVVVVTTGFIIAISLFAMAGALRNRDEPEADFQNAWERFAFAEDANMLDGFVLLRQVYPDRLKFSLGQEHFEIFLRPIPRAWWPDKPVGGYMNKLGIITADTGFTLGISPSLFGSFYQEGGAIGIVVLSAIYGFAFGKLIRFSARVLPFTGLLIRGCACAALIPLLRGGDLPGNYAWFGMSFWPLLLLMMLKRRDLFLTFFPGAISATTVPTLSTSRR